MGLISWIKEKLGGEIVPLNVDPALIDEYAELGADIHIRELAFWSAINLISNAVSKCEFKTFVNKKETKAREYYLWNFEPNKNQNSSAFLHKLIAKLYRDNECLVIEQNGQLLVADSFTKTPYALYEDMFSQVEVKDFTFNRSFAQSEVLYFQLSEVNVRKVINGLYDSYSKLISYSMKSYQRSRGTKGIFKYDTIPVAGTPERTAFDSLINEKISKWLSGDNAALPLGRGQEWKELERKTYSSESTRDIRAQIDDIFDFTARGFGIPPALLKGDVQDTSKSVDELLTFCIDPLVDNLSEEINRKRNGYAGFSQGTYLKIDTKTIKHVEMLGVATAIDKLIGSGSFCINDIRKAVGDEPIDEPWANQHFITKNYETVESALKALEGGEKNSEE
ncbi:phage portal protein [Clostridium sp. Bc-iso-3]|nr:phage portal protein [Clostridium sp. Bc-iso-3]